MERNQIKHTYVCLQVGVTDEKSQLYISDQVIFTAVVQQLPFFRCCQVSNWL